MKVVRTMDKIVEWLGEGEWERRMERIRRFWAGDGGVMVSFESSESPYRQLFDDARILGRAPDNFKAQASLPGCNLPAFAADYGTVSTARYWGGKTFFPHEGSKDIFIEPAAKTIEEALALPVRAVDDPEMDAVRGLDLYRRLCAKLETDRVWLRTPDFQGTLNTAALVMDQQELMMGMLGEPALVHRFLDKVGDFLIAYHKRVSTGAGGKVCGNIWPYTFLPADIGASFTEDFMPLIGADEYREFGIPCVEKMSRAFGGVHIHCCGQWGRHAANLARSSANILAMEFHHPYTRVEELEPLLGKVVLIPYIALSDPRAGFKSAVEYYRWLLKEHGREARFWFPFCGESEETLAFAAELGFNRQKTVV